MFKYILKIYLIKLIGVTNVIDCGYIDYHEIWTFLF